MDAFFSRKRSWRPRSQSWMIRVASLEHRYDETDSVISSVLVMFSWLLFTLTFPLSLMFCLKVVAEYERAVLFRLGRLMSHVPMGPGLFFMLPCVDSFRKVDLRVMSFEVPAQEILSKDSVTVTVEAVVYFHVSNPVVSVVSVNDAFFSTRLLAQTTLRNILGLHTLAQMLSARDTIAQSIKRILDEGTVPWGVQVDRVEVKDIRLPHELMRAMAIEAEASRGARAKQVAAEGEQRASRALHSAAATLANCPVATHLRYLQTLTGLAAQRNHTVVLPMPMRAVKELMKWRHSMRKQTTTSTKPVQRQTAIEIETGHEDFGN